MPPRPAQRANGSLSARQWQDLRQAARLARSEGVTIEWRGINNVTIIPGSARTPQRPVRKEQVPRQMSPRDKSSDEPSDPEAPAAKSKKHQRDALRAQEHRAEKQTKRWYKLSLAALRRARWQEGQAVWTQWMRARMSPPRDARRKIRLAFWREWTRPQLELSPGLPETADYPRQVGFADLGLRSHRDEYILQLVRARCARLTDARPWALRLRPFRYWVGGEWDQGKGCLNQADRDGHVAILENLRNFLPDGRLSGGLKLDMRAFRRQATAEETRQMLADLENATMFSPRNPDLPRVLAAFREALQGYANEPGGTTACGRKSSTRSRDDPSSARADRKRRGRR